MYVLMFRSVTRTIILHILISTISVVHLPIVKCNYFNIESNQITIYIFLLYNKYELSFRLKYQIVLTKNKISCKMNENCVFRITYFSEND